MKLGTGLMCQLGRRVAMLLPLGALVTVSCASSPSVRLPGRLLYANGNNLAMLDLATGRNSDLTRWHLATCSEGVCWLGAGRVVTCCVPLSPGEHDERIVTVNLATGDSMIIGRGEWAAATADSGPLLWYASRGAQLDSECVLMTGSAGRLQGGITVAPGPTGHLAAGSLHWSDMVLNPVTMDSGRVAFRGALGSVMLLDTERGTVRPLGEHDGLPVLWRPAARKLVCFKGTTDWTASEFTPGQDSLSRIPALDHAVGWAVIGEGDSLLVCTPHRGFELQESWDLLLYDGTTGKVQLVAPGMLVYRGAEFLRN